MSTSATNAGEQAADRLPELRSSFTGARLAPPRSKPRPPHRRTERPFAGAILVLVLLGAGGLAAQSSIRRALGAYWTSWPGSTTLSEALAIDVSNPVTHRRAAFLAAQRDADPAAALAELRETVRLSPLDLNARLELAAMLQASGEDDQAEATLREAAEIDRGYRPRWSLTNFYLRQGRIDEFWESARSALLAYPESTPMVLGLCWRAFADSTLILDKAVPDSPEVYRKYFAYLLEQERLEALAELWPRLATGLEGQDVPMASLFLDRLILAENVELAVEVWNRLCSGKFLSYTPLAYPSGPYLTNGDFATRISGFGFDWKVPPARGVFRVQRPADFGTRALEIRLSGSQGESAILLSQVTPLPPGRYLFRYEYATQRLPRLTGLYWVVRDNQTDRILAQSPFIEAAEDYWNTLSFLFDAAEDSRFLRLELRYTLPEGVENHRGRYVMRHAALTSVAGEEAAAK